MNHELDSKVTHLPKKRVKLPSERDWLNASAAAFLTKRWTAFSGVDRDSFKRSLSYNSNTEA